MHLTLLEILWNHRWEFDKNPEAFFEAIFTLVDNDVDFELSVAGEKFKRYPEIFSQVEAKLGNRLKHFGFADSKEAYINLLQSNDVVVSTADHEFFGVSMIEATHAGCLPVVPRRLSYPEIFSEYENSVFYDDDKELQSLLTDLSCQLDVIRRPENRIDLGKYSWSQRAKDFDQKFA